MPDFYSRYFTNCKKPQKLLVFLHGINNSLSDLRPFYQTFCQEVKGLVVAAPQGEFRSEKNHERKSWYKISGFDVDGRRFKEDTDVEEIARIYNQAAPVLAENALNLNDYLDRVQQKYGLDDAHTFVAGFSQGAMLALWTALIRKHKIAGCFVLSGFAAAHTALEPCIVSRPHVYLLHGEKDQRVLFKCMPYTKKWLQSQNVPVKTKSYAGLSHQISTEELSYMTEVMNKTSCICFKRRQYV